MTKKVISALSKLTIYRKLLNDKIIKKFLKVLKVFDKKDKNKLSGLYYELIYLLNHIEEAIDLQNNTLKSYIFRRIIEDENIFSILCENNKIKENNLIYKQGINDLKSLKALIDYDFSEIKTFINDETDYFTVDKSSSYDLFEFENNFIDNKNLKEITKSICSYYLLKAYGKIGFYKVFSWKNSELHGVINYDNISFDNIYHYEYQKNILIENTKAFVEGRPANNVLLVGARGTGKSSSVKALVDYFDDKDLKLIEIYKDQLEQLSNILAILKNRNKKFIIFIDDLSFEEDETNYKHLKSIIEGGVEKRPDNILLYATSNRRHLIRETWTDRESNDVHGNDTINEKLSLSDRFGISITFQAPKQEAYFEIVKGIGKKFNIDVESKDFILEAKRWAISQNARSGRTARQFIDNYLGKY